MKKLARYIRSVRIQNFKAIYDSKSLKLSPFTVFIGNNGSGKSSVIEALETLQVLRAHDLDAAMQLWHGLEHIRNKSRRKTNRPDSSSKKVSIRLMGKIDGVDFISSLAINERGDGNEIFLEEDTIEWANLKKKKLKGLEEIAYFFGPESLQKEQMDAIYNDYIKSWQLLRTVPAAMGNTRPQTRSTRKIQLSLDGSNLAEYLWDIRNKSLAAFEGIVETLQYVLPYAMDIQPSITTELERQVYLQLSERKFKIPGWLLSSGTLRILALLAVFRHPTPPPLILIEEIENGLDPRTIHLIINEIQRVVKSGRSQVIVTTHSPYLLDLVPLSSIILVEREDGGDPIFSRPGDDKEKQGWAKRFSPGQLYTMNRLSRRGDT